MTTPPGADERRARVNLLRALDGAPASRSRDWLDDLLDSEHPAPRPAVPPPPPDTPPKKAAVADEPRWDWRRLRHWPYARLTCGACAALLPFFGGQSAATEWGSVLTQARAQAGVGAAWVIAGVGLTVGALWVHRRRSWIGWAVLTSAFIGGIAMASPYDIVTLFTGVMK